MALKFIIVIIFSVAQCCYAAPAAVTLIGHFSNMEWTSDNDPHATDGYTVSLYRAGDVVFGNLAAANGSGEPVQGRLYDINFDPATRKISFKSKYSSGWSSGPGIPKEGHAAHDLFIFKGRILAKRLVGKVTILDGYSPDAPGENRSVSIPRQKENYTPKDFAEWRARTYLDNDW